MFGNIYPTNVWDKQLMHIYDAEINVATKLTILNQNLCCK